MNIQRFYRILLPIAALSLLQACDARPLSQLEKQSILDQFASDGPEVSGVSDALLSTAKQAEKVGDYARASQFYKQLVDKEPQNTMYLIGYAENLRKLEKLDAALQAYEQILQLQPNHLNALEGKGLTLVSKTEFAQASPPLERVIQLAPTRWKALNGVGILFIAKGMTKEALAYFDAALAQKPDHPSVLNNVGLTLAMMEDYPRAFQALNRASSYVKAKSLQRQRIDLNLALVLGISGDIERAERVASKHLSDAALQNNLGFYAQLAGNSELAKAYLNSALAGSPTFYEKAWENLEAVR
jgi:Flp pilus assembly protein TadD